MLRTGLILGMVAFLAVVAIACQPVQPVEMSEQSSAHAGIHQIEGRFGFPSPEAWGVDLWIEQQFDVTELDPQSHEATGSLNFGVYNVDSREWKRIQSDVKYALFDNEANAAMVISQITEKTGTGEGEPGEYACFWVKDGEGADLFGMHYYSDFRPEVGFKEYFPAEDAPAVEYAEPGEVLEIESGDVAILQ